MLLLTAESAAKELTAELVRGPGGECFAMLVTIAIRVSRNFTIAPLLYFVFIESGSELCFELR